MPLTNFYNFEGCLVPTMSSCILKDQLNNPHTNGLVLDAADVKFTDQSYYWNSGMILGHTFILTCTSGSDVYESEIF